MSAQCAPRTELEPDEDRGTVDDAVARLAAEFPAHPPVIVSITVTQCRRDLDGVPPGALPEMLERLARQRLRTSA